MPHLQEAIDEGLDFDTVFCLNDLAAMWKTWKRKSAERLCRRCFCENGAAGRVAGRPGRGMGSKRKPSVPRRQRKNREEERKVVLGGAWRAKRSLWCPAVKEKTGKKRENPSRAGHRRRKRAVMPRRQRKSREEERKSEAGGAWRSKGSLWCPAVKEKAGKKRENPRRAGHGEQKEVCGAPPPEKKQGRREEIRGGRGMGSKRKPLVPRRQRKNREEERKSKAGGAQEKKKSFGAPPPKKKQGRREEIRGGRGMGSKKKLSYPACHQ